MWNLDSGAKTTTGLRTTVDSLQKYPKTIEVNDKLWLTGGYLNNEHTLYSAATDFLDKDNVWEKGPNLPLPRAAYGMVLLSATSVFIFGGKPYGQSSYLFNDLDQTYTSKPAIPYESSFAYNPSGIRLQLKVEGDIIFIPEKDRAVIFKINEGIWVDKNEWKYPNPVHQRTIIQLDKKLYFLGGFNWNDGDYHYSNEVLEFQDGKWIERCPLPIEAPMVHTTLMREITFP